MDNETDEIIEVKSKGCLGCGEPSMLKMRRSQFEAYRDGAFVQVAFADWTPEQRELVVSGTHPACWTTMFGEEED